MAYKITDSCIMCGACESACPVGAISAGDTQYQIDESACIECGACTYTCPARLPLTHMFRMGKQQVNNARMAAKAKAEAEKAAAEKKEA